MYTFTAFCRKLIFPPKTGSDTLPLERKNVGRVCESGDLSFKLPVSLQLLKTRGEGLSLFKASCSSSFVSFQDVGPWNRSSKVQVPNTASLDQRIKSEDRLHLGVNKRSPDLLRTIRALSRFNCCGDPCHLPSPASTQQNVFGRGKRVKTVELGHGIWTKIIV